MRKMPTVPVSVWTGVGWATSFLGNSCLSYLALVGSYRHPCWLVREGMAVCPILSPVGWCSVPLERPKVTVGLPLRIEGPLPGSSPSLGHTAGPSQPLTYPEVEAVIGSPREFIALGTICAVDSPALTSLPLKQALRLGAGLGWDLGLLPTLPA